MRPNVDPQNNLQSELDWGYACPTNKELNCISAGVLKITLSKLVLPP
jgi:hypothetical protein